MHDQLYIDGRWQPGRAGRRFQTRNPATGEALAELPQADASDVDSAVAAAAAALRGPWGAMPPAERGALIMALARRVREDRQALAELETLDVGKPLRDSLGDVDGAARTLEYNAGAADKLQGDTIPLGPDVVDFTRLEPLGVTGHIIPWNFPLGMAVRSAAPALAAGCSVVLKPAEQAPLSPLRLAALAGEAGFPPGVINVLTGDGPETGAALVRHLGVRGITFTGSVETGRLILAAAAGGLKPVVLELGGKNALIVFPDADLDRAVADAMMGIFENCGQVCSSASRLILHRDIKDRFLEMLVARVRALSIGPGLENPDLGPLVTAEQRDRVEGYVQAGQRAGASLLYGGGRPAGLERGYFLEPAIFDGVTPDMSIAREEIFGPVAGALTFETEAQALALADGVEYGLVAGVYTQDISRALRLAAALQTGSVWINGWYLGGVQAPVGGYKNSGYGRERGLAGIHNYLQIKNIGIRL